MSFPIKFKCINCGEIRNEPPHVSGACEECRGKEDENLKERYLNGLANLSLEEKITLISEMLWDLMQEVEKLKENNE